jgi:hypothetical protein
MLSARRERELDRRNCERSQSAGRLRSRAATRLNGDPNDLIRTMPAKGDRPADPCLGGETGALPPGAQPGESSCGCPRRRRHRAYWRRSGAPPAGEPGIRAVRHDRGLRRLPWRVIAAGRLARGKVARPGDADRVVPYQKEPNGLRRVAIVTAASFARPQGRHGFPCQSRDSCSLPCFLSTGGRISRHDTSEPRRPAGKPVGPGASVAAPLRPGHARASGPRPGCPSPQVLAGTTSPPDFWGPKVPVAREHRLLPIAG